MNILTVPLKVTTEPELLEDNIVVLERAGVADVYVP